ncbi:MAG: hypothetical protein FJ320_05035 [SAR202 cluster bacterium]|nr:hypothetical protein [SAR202 cluster bacterium]
MVGVKTDVRKQVRELMLDYILPDYSENRPEVKDRIVRMSNALTNAQAEAFLSVYDCVTEKSNRDSIRTRQAMYAPNEWSVGFTFYNTPITRKGSSSEVMSCLFPSKTPDSLEFYFSGIERETSGKTFETRSMRFNLPVRRGSVKVTEQNKADVIQWACRLFDEGYSYSRRFLQKQAPSYPQFVVDEKGNKLAVVLDHQEFEDFIGSLKEFMDNIDQREGQQRLQIPQGYERVLERVAGE